MLRSVLQMDRTPLDMVILGLQKVAARLERKQARPLTREWVDGYIHSRTDWKERVVFRPAWITASCRSEIAALTPNNFTLEHNFGLVRGVKDGEGGLPPSFAVRQDTRRAGRVRHYNVMQDTSTQRKL
ncbi:trans-sialidase, partial [Trypanosoma cruzi]